MPHRSCASARQRRRARALFAAARAAVAPSQYCRSMANAEARFAFANRLSARSPMRPCRANSCKRRRALRYRERCVCTRMRLMMRVARSFRFATRTAAASASSRAAANASACVGALPMRPGGPNSAPALRESTGFGRCGMNSAHKLTPGGGALRFHSDVVAGSARCGRALRVAVLVAARCGVVSTVGPILPSSRCANAGGAARSCATAAGASRAEECARSGRMRTDARLCAAVPATSRPSPRPKSSARGSGGGKGAVSRGAARGALRAPVCAAAIGGGVYAGNCCAAASATRASSHGVASRPKSSARGSGGGGGKSAVLCGAARGAVRIAACNKAAVGGVYAGNCSAAASTARASSHRVAHRLAF